MPDSLNICIISPSKDVYCETFIKAHVENLPGRVELLYGGHFPQFYGNNERILNTRSLLTKCLYFFERILFGTEREVLESRTLAALFRERKFDIVLAEYGQTGVAVMLACRMARIPLVVHFHGYDAHAEKVIESAYGVKYKELFEFASAIVCVSRTMRERLLSLGASEEKLHLNPYGVDVDRINTTDPSKNPPRFLAVGRLVDKKAPYLTLLAFQKVAIEIPSASLTFIGDGYLREMMENLVCVFKLKGKVEILGACSHEEVFKRMAEARAFVQHSVQPKYGASIGDSEGTPVAILEALASGLPVVSTIHAGIQEAVIHGKNGFLVEERDIDNMAGKMLLLAKEPTLATQMGIEGRRHIAANYSMSNSICQLHWVMFRVAEK